MADYRAALDRLCDRGLAYRCFRTRKEVAQEIASAPMAPRRPFGGPPCLSSRKPSASHGESPSPGGLSLQAARSELGDFADLTFEEEGAGPEGQQGRITARPDLAGDIILARKDVGVAYHLAVTVDDALQGVTHIVRGEDLFEATHIQRMLQALLGSAHAGLQAPRTLAWRRRRASGKTPQGRDPAKSPDCGDETRNPSKGARV